MNTMRVSLELDKDVPIICQQKGVTRIPLVTEDTLNSLSVGNEIMSDDDDSSSASNTPDGAKESDEDNRGGLDEQDTGS